MKLLFFCGNAHLILDENSTRTSGGAELQVAPVLLVDDVLGELDPQRKAGFWQACPHDLQIIATGTELPGDADDWTVWRVADGQVVSG